MIELSYRRHRFPPVVIQHAVWLYLRFTLSYRDIEDHASVHNTFNLQGHLVSLRIFRAEAASEWRNAVAAV
jgi:transposase-like protein